MVVVIVAEKPSVAEDLAGVLGASNKQSNYWEGNNLKITWAVGHLLELKQPEEYDEVYAGRWKMDNLPILPDVFEARPTPSQSKSKSQLKAIKKLLKEKEVTEIVNACDAAREGELIFWRIYDHANITTGVTRMWMQSMTKDAIKDAWDTRQPGENYYNLRDAAFARSQADWIIGMNGTRAATIRLPKKRGNKSPYSIGRVQTATLAILVDRELEHLAHIPEPYWTISVDVNAASDPSSAAWSAKWTSETGTHPTRITEQSELTRIEAVLSNDSEISVSETSKDRKENAPLNFDLTTLQKIANSRWNWPARKTLSVAQSLYDQYKLTTYPRTDSKYLTSDMQGPVEDLLKQLNGQAEYSEHCQRLQNEGLTNTKRNFNSSKVGDHFAIIPTGKTPPSNITADASRMYDLIVRRFLASFHSNSVWIDNVRTTTKESETFVAKGTSLKTPGWRAVIPKKDGVQEGWGSLPSNPCAGVFAAISVNEEETKPKTRLKEAGLLSAMENAGKIIEDDEEREAIKGKGLGTPATRAETIETLMRRGYVDRLNSGGMRATSRGILLIDVMRRIPIDWIASAKLTGEMEARLSEVNEGKLSKDEYLDDIKQRTTDLISLMSTYDVDELYEETEPLGICPLCQNNVIENLMTYSCEKNDRGKGCKFVMWKDSCGRHFDYSTAVRLLEHETLTGLHGFVNRNNDEFNADIKRSEKGSQTFLNNGPSQADIEAGEVLTDCPDCQTAKIHTTPTHWACANQDCNARSLSRVNCHRTMQASEALDYYDKGETEVFDDFISKKGAPFSAKLVRKNGRMKYEFPPRGSRAPAVELPKYPVTEGVVAVFKSKGVEVNVVENETHFITVENDAGIELEIPRTVSSRELTRDEAKILIEKKKVGPLEGFTSKKGNLFNSKLTLKRNGRIGYQF